MVWILYSAPISIADCEQKWEPEGNLTPRACSQWARRFDYRKHLGNRDVNHAPSWRADAIRSSTHIVRTIQWCCIARICSSMHERHSKILRDPASRSQWNEQLLELIAKAEILCVAVVIDQIELRSHLAMLLDTLSPRPWFPASALCWPS